MRGSNHGGGEPRARLSSRQTYNLVIAACFALSILLLNITFSSRDERVDSHLRRGKPVTMIAVGLS